MATIPTVVNLQTLILQLQAQVAALEIAASTAAPTVPAATTAATTAVVFADTPQMLGAKDPIDYSSKQGQRSTSKELHHSMTNHLPMVLT